MRKVNEMLRMAVAEILLREVELPLGSFVTVTSVDTSRDLKHAVVYVTVLPDGKRISIIKQLQSSRGHVQQLLGKRISLKFTPKIRFDFDEGFIKAQHVYDALDSTP